MKGKFAARAWGFGFGLSCIGVAAGCSLPDTARDTVVLNTPTVSHVQSYEVLCADGYYSYCAYINPGECGDDGMSQQTCSRIAAIMDALSGAGMGECVEAVSGITEVMNSGNFRWHDLSPISATYTSVYVWSGPALGQIWLDPNWGQDDYSFVMSLIHEGINRTLNGDDAEEGIDHDNSGDDPCYYAAGGDALIVIR
jgi:hypothetical protein